MLYPNLGSFFSLLGYNKPQENRETKTACCLWLFSQACGSQNTGGRKVSRGWHGKGDFFF